MAWKPGEIEWEKLELYIKVGSTQKKICQAFGITENTLRSRAEEHYGVEYSQFCASLKGTGILLIEAKQFEQAMKGNIKMLIHLGRIRCEQDAGVVYAQPPNEQLLELTHEVMHLKHENTKLKLEVMEAQNANQCKARRELQRSDTPLQHMGGGSELGEDLFEH